MTVSLRSVVARVHRHSLSAPSLTIEQFAALPSDASSSCCSLDSTSSTSSSASSSSSRPPSIASEHSAHYCAHLHAEPGPMADSVQLLGTLVVVVLKAQNLIDNHTFYKQDPYCVLSLASQKQHTKPEPKGGQHPVWDEEMRFPITSTGSRSLKVQVYSKEKKDDNLLGEGSVDIAPVLKSGEFDDWVPLSLPGAGTRGDVYLEMTFFAAGPAPLNRRKSKFTPAQRLARPPDTPPVPHSQPSSPPHTSAHLTPHGGRSYSASSARDRDSALPPLPPAAAAAPAPAPAPLPAILRAGAGGAARPRVHSNVGGSRPGSYAPGGSEDGELPTPTQAIYQSPYPPYHAPGAPEPANPPHQHAHGRTSSFGSLAPPGAYSAYGAPGQGYAHEPHGAYPQQPYPPQTQSGYAPQGQSSYGQHPPPQSHTPQPPLQSQSSYAPPPAHTPAPAQQSGYPPQAQSSYNPQSHTPQPPPLQAQPSYAQPPPAPHTPAPPSHVQSPTGPTSSYTSAPPAGFHFPLPSATPAPSQSQPQGQTYGGPPPAGFYGPPPGSRPQSYALGPGQQPYYARGPSPHPPRTASGSSSDLPDPYLERRYQTPLPLPGSPPRAAHSAHSSFSGAMPTQQNGAGGLSDADAARALQLREAEEARERRRAQEEKDAALARELDAQLNLAGDGPAPPGQGSGGIAMPGAW